MDASSLVPRLRRKSFGRDQRGYLRGEPRLGSAEKEKAILSALSEIAAGLPHGGAERVNLYASRWERGEDIYSGNPLTGQAADEWLALANARSQA